MSASRSAATRALLAVAALLLSPAAFAKRYARCDSRTEAALVERLAQQVSRANLYADWARPQCLRYELEACSAESVDIAIREHHGGACDGDPATAPVVDRFRVHRASARIDWYDAVNDEMLTFEAVCSRRPCASTPPASTARR